MTATLPPVAAAPAPPPAPTVRQPLPEPPHKPPVTVGHEPHAQANPTFIALASGLSSAAAAWLIGGLFRDFSAHFVALAGVAIGTVMVVLSQRIPRAAVLQWLTAPVAFVVGLVFTAPDLSGGSTLARLVSDAVHTGGLLQPPVAFSPGWKVILVTLLAVVATGAASLAIGLQRPRLGVVFPLPLAMGAAVIQPASAQLVSAGVAVALTVAALSVAHGAELGRTGQLAAAFEARRLGRTTALAAALFAVIAVINNAGFLFPQPDRSHVIPPQPPPVSPPLSDRVLLTYAASAPQPLRLGVIDVYDSAQSAWLLPEFDARRLERLEAPIAINTSRPRPGKPVTVSVTLGNWDGRSLPSIAGLTQVRGIDGAVSYDPRSEAISLADRPATPGMRYTLVALPEPTGRLLAAAGPPPASLSALLEAPSPPNEAVVIISDCRKAAANATSGNDLFDILQCVRQKLYGVVVAQGPGVPSDVSPARVGQMLHGAPASPYEITAAEALMARWVGVPARIGYGYYGGDKQANGSYEIHPHHGATWLEAYFNGIGWIPLVGQPARATASTSPAEKNSVPAIAAEHLQLVLYIPYQRPNLTLFYEIVQYALLQVLPVVVAIALLVAGYPWFLKRLRSRRRQRWAMRTGLSERIAVAYCELRDRARDLGAGDPSRSPVAFLSCIAPDAEHEELAWLVSRALWGDLRRDLRIQDAVAAEQWSRSVARRLDRAQPVVNRVLARVSRASLREPYSPLVPNVWRELQLRQRVRGALGVRSWLHPRRARRHRAAFGAGIATLILLGTSCGTSSPAARMLPHHLVPDATSGIHFVNQPSVAMSYRNAGGDALISGGAVYTVVASGITYGDVQVEVFKPGLIVDDINDESRSSHCADDPKDCPGHEVFRGIQQDLAGTFHRLYYENQRIYQLTLSDQTVYVWFPPNTETMVMLVLIQRFGSTPATALMHALLDYEHHRAETAVPAPAPLSGGTV